MSSIGTDFTTSYLNSLTSQASSLKKSQQASDVEKVASGISKNSSKEELTNAAKTFESYFVEQVIKEVKKTNDELKGDDDTDAYAQQMSDMYMDTTIQTLASDIVDDYGDRFTEDMVKNMQAQYGITDTDRS